MIAYSTSDKWPIDLVYLTGIPTALSRRHYSCVFVLVVKYKVKVKVILEQATKTQRGSRVIALLFL